jgi:hypothetical protein
VSATRVSGGCGPDFQDISCTRPRLLSVLLFFVIAALFAPSSFAQKFKNPTLIPTGSDPSTVTEADVNGDGKPDLIYLDGTAPKQLHVLLGNGDGTFAAGQNVHLPSSIGGTITVADLNKDSKPDLILGGDTAKGEIAVLLGNGDGSFQTAIVSTFTPTVTAYVEMNSLIGVADFDGDGSADLAASDILNNKVYILTGNNKGSFTLKSTLMGEGTPSKVLTADLNGDGHQDLVVQMGGSVMVYLGKGDGTFQAGVNYTGIDNVQGFLLTDFDGDSRPDLAVVGYDSSIAILHGNSDGTFAATSEGGSSYSGPSTIPITAADFNSDGTLDIATASINGIGIELGQSGLKFSAPKFYSGSPTAMPVAVGDFNGDGHLDFAEIAPGGIALLFGAANGRLVSADVYDLGPNQSNTAVAVADFNGDKIPDIATADLQPAPVVLLGNGSGQFSVPSGLSTPTSPPAGQLYTGDFNGDGKADLLLTGVQNQESVYLGAGNGTFGAPTTLNIPVGSYGYATIADFNHDGKSDIASLDYSSLDVFLGQASGSFAESSYPDTYMSIQGIAAGDFNQDGKIDLVASRDQTNPLQIYLGNGDGTFHMADEFFGPNLPNVIATADVDGDGHIDLVVDYGYYNEVQILYGNGDGTFETPVSIPTLRQYMQLSVADMNGDGMPDLILSDGMVLTIIPNTGARTFGSEQHFLAGAIESFAIKDVNGDSLPDIVVANGSLGGPWATTVTVFLNQGVSLPLSGTLTLNPTGPIGYKKPFVINLQLATEKSGAPTPTGTVVLAIDDSPVTSLKVSGLNLSYTDSNSIEIGSHTLVATYSGDANYLASSFTLPFQIVANTYPTSTALVASTSTATAGQTVRFTATVTSPDGTIDAPNIISGNVSFRDGTINLGTVALNSSDVAVFDTPVLAAGSHSITANFLGMEAIAQEPGNFAPSSSPAVSVTINATKTTTSISSTPTTALAGAEISLTAVVKAASSTPTGAVEFMNGSTPLAVQPLDATGTAVVGITFANAGTATVTAVYQANGSFASSASSALGVTISSATATQSVTSLSSSPTSQSSNSLRLTAAVTSKKSSPTGNVVFMDGAAQVGQAALDASGIAEASIRFADSGVHYLRAVYSGDTKLTPSVSAVLSEQMPLGVPSFSVNVASSSIMMQPGQSSSIAVTINAANGFKSPVALSCTTNSSDVSCSLTASSFASGAGTTSVTIGAFSRQASTISVIGDWRKGFQAHLIATTCLLVSFATLMARRRRMGAIFALIVLMLAGAACSGNRNSLTIDAAPGAYIVTVTASSSNGASPASRSVPIDVAVAQP